MQCVVDAVLVITIPQRQQLKQKIVCKGGCVRPSQNTHSSVASFTSLKFSLYIKVKGKAVPLQVYYRSRGFQEAEASRFQDSRLIKVVRFSALRTDRLYSFLLEVESAQGNSAATRMLMKNSSDTISNQTCDFPAFSTVPQPTAPPFAPFFFIYIYIYI